MNVRSPIARRPLAEASLAGMARPSSTLITFLVLVLGIGAFLFYWFQLRPMYVYRSCARQASADARILLGSKAEIAKGTALGVQYAGLLEKNMYLRSDYNSFLQKCLLNHGLSPYGVPAEEGVQG